jgi:hypothetical protein
VQCRLGRHTSGCTTGRTPARKRFKTLKELKTLLKPRQGFEGVLDACEEIWPAWAANGCRKLDLRVRDGTGHTKHQECAARALGTKMLRAVSSVSLC